MAVLELLIDMQVKELIMVAVYFYLSVRWAKEFDLINT